MTDSIAHRGPDGDGHWVCSDGRVGLGHRRLAIIDLSDAGRQPMSYADGRYQITFNGEIYNYLELRDELEKSGVAFRSDSDTEVLLALYHQKREKCLGDLDGMFAFAIWDKKERTLFCSRDRFGEKPFYYALHDDHLYFASEMKALWAAGVPRRFNHQMLFNFLAYGYTFNFNDRSTTFFEGIHKLEAAHFFVVSPDVKDVVPQRYWAIDNTQIDDDIEDSVAAERFRELFTQSVRRRLRSDVPVGSSLSGGLDSSLVVCVIDEINRDRRVVQNTFSARFPGFAKDEGRYMNLVIEKTRVRPHFVFPDEGGMLNDLDRLCHHQEEPFGSASIYAQFCVMRLAKEHDTTVLLDGQGADEIMAGYHFYFPDFFRELRSRDRRRYAQERKVHREIHGRGANGLALKSVLKAALAKVPQNIENDVRRLNTSFWQTVAPSMDADFFNQYSKGANHPNTPSPRTLSESLYKTIADGSLEELLRYADRNSMAHSREVRLPFLNHQLVEFAFTLPSRALIRNGVTKYIMRQAFRDLLPPEILNRTDKIGYEPPQASWMDSPVIKTRLSDLQAQLRTAKILHKNFSVTEQRKKDSTLAWRTLMAGMLYQN